ncbi:uncharacterized protein BJ212DRAFT_1475453 [Suillus subaureus]|uniref:Uncharacterized protein n=1 Tax=Suillus subaureus TaxID=48587 RepID=A0A9P7EMH1_9AGAM|nr:uncharacterized protein BJ212DRAFT_1475453 [Suillus subaureus]KAG1826115.1 hypothetical protein BJ212DRAFT_1475453 [Suillus subaureus]
MLVNSCRAAGPLSHQHAAHPEVHPIPTSAQPIPPSFSQYPPLLPLQYLPPLLCSILPPLHCSTLPPLQYPPNLPQPGARGGPIDNPDGDMEDDPHADDDYNNDGPFGTPLGNALDTLDRDFEMCGDDDDDGLEVNSSWCCVISLDSPPKVVGHKRQYAASPSPPCASTNSFILPCKAQTPMYHSCEAFGSASPGSHAPLKLPLSLGILCSHSSPSSTTSSLAYISSDYWILPTASQMSLSAKPQSSVSLKKKRTSVVDMEGQISMLNDEIKSMHSDMSERRELRNEHYALKMNY